MTRNVRRPRRARLGTPRRRLRFGLVVVLGLFSIIAGRLVQLQGLDGTAYATQAAKSRMHIVTLQAQRGSILDRNGGVLARSVEADAVFADPKLVNHPSLIGATGSLHNTAEALAPVLNIPINQLVKQMSGTGRFVYLRRGVDPELAQQVMDLNLPGIGTLPETKREVPGGNLASHVIGFTNTDGVGLAGVELQDNSVLAGKDGEHRYEIGAQGQQIPGGYNQETPAVPGRSVELTIDRDVQYYTQQALFDRAYQVSAYSASAVVLDARTFQVLGMASYPTYDASNPGAAKPSARVNQAISDVVEPGSIHKVVTLGAALQDGVIGKNYAPVVPPTITKGGKLFADTHPHGVIRLTLQGILAQSSNVGTIETADKLGANRLYEFQKKFGLGSPTGIGLPGESGGILQPPKNWSGPAYGGIPIGLGVAVTPLQMAAVYATVANDGVRMTPSIVKGFRSADGTFTPAPAKKGVRVLSVKNAKILRGAMSAIATTEGTGTSAAIPGYVIAGKTGTGQRTQNGQYLPGNVESFIGMAPFDHPQYVVAVFVHSPYGTGGVVAAPAFQQIMSYVLRHYHVPPSNRTAPPVKIYGPPLHPAHHAVPAERQPSGVSVAGSSARHRVGH